MADNLFSLEGKNILVTGSTQGIGRALAEGLARAGARVVLNGRSGERTRVAVDECKAEGLLAEGVAFDVTDEDAVADGIREVRSLVGDIHVLVNNAGGTIRGKMVDMSFEDWRHVLSVNLDSAFLVSRAVLPEMIERHAGKIINICSLMSQIARTDNSSYAASKGGIGMLTKQMAVELGKENIQVNGVGPGFFDTPLTAVLKENEEFDAWVRSRAPMARWGRTEELVGTTVYLASSASNFVTGQIIYVDGGFTAAM